MEGCWRGFASDGLEEPIQPVEIGAGLKLKFGRFRGGCWIFVSDGLERARWLEEADVNLKPGI